MSNPSADPFIEYIYAAHSAFAYLGSSRLKAIAEASGRTILHRPVNLRKVVAATGNKPSAQRTPEHRKYYFGREIARWSQYREAPVIGRTPTRHANGIERSNCTIIAAMEAGHNVNALAHTLLEAHWRDDVDLDDSPTLERLTNDLGLDGKTLVAASHAPEVLALYNQYTENAIERSVFGSPTYVVDGDMFYGQDHLEMVERALHTPFK